MAGAVEMAEKLPYAQLHIFELSGHMVFMEEPEELIAVLKEWITSTASQRNWREDLAPWLDLPSQEEGRT